MGSTIACCVARENGADDGSQTRSSSWQAHQMRRQSSINSDSSSTRWFDCAEHEEDLLSLSSSHAEREPQHLESLRCDSVDGADKICGQRFSPLSSSCAERSLNLVMKHLNTTDVAAWSVLENALDQWRQRMDSYMKGSPVGSKGETLLQLLRDGCPEIEWADLYSARRMLRAMLGDEQKAIAMLVNAIEFRVRDRALFTTMRCQVNADIRVIGKDKQQQPTVYMCARSQRVPLKDIRDQLILAFEAACRMTTPEGKVCFVADMFGLSPRLNMDVASVRDVSETLGTIYAERIGSVLVVDFSRTAQAVWWLLQPLLSEGTRKKFAFVGGVEAKERCRKLYDDDVYERIASSLDVNRDLSKTEQELKQHALRTAAVPVPLGLPPGEEQ